MWVRERSGKQEKSWPDLGGIGNSNPEGKEWFSRVGREIWLGGGRRLEIAS